MKKLLVLAVLLVLLVGAIPASAQTGTAYVSSWVSEVHFQNVGSAPATISFDFYTELDSDPNNNAAIPMTMQNTLAVNASTTIAVGSVSGIGTTFKGSAVISSSEPLFAMMTQTSSTLFSVPASNGFSSDQTATRQTIATVLRKNSGYTTLFSVQNADSSVIDVYVNFMTPGNSTPTLKVVTQDILVGAAEYYDVATLAGLTDGFSGSAVVTGTIANTLTPANIVVAANELQYTPTGAGGASSFEGASQSASTVYMASALCRYNRTSTFAGFTTYYAVSNASTTSLTFQVRYKQTGKADVIDGPYVLAAGAKRSIDGCAKFPIVGSTIPTMIGAAIIERTAGTGEMIAVGKVAGGNITSAALGAPAGTGTAKISVPFVRWSQGGTAFNTGKRFQTYLTVQNIGGADATNVTVRYYDKDGVLKGTHALGTITSGAKKSSDPIAGAATTLTGVCRTFGEYGATTANNCFGTSFGGGAIVTADSGAQLAVVVRIVTGSPTKGGEDYNGIPVAP